MDTTFIVNAQGQTIGIVHEKGTIPVMPARQQQRPNNVRLQPAVQPEMQPLQASPAFNFDSTAYYQSLIDKYAKSGKKMSTAGIGLLVGGAVASLKNAGFSAG